VIACLEKSGSTSLEICVREMLRTTMGVEHDVGIQKSLAAGPFSYVDALYPEILLYARNGGVLRSFLAPSTTNIVMLNWLIANYVVLTRHPADRLVARYCQLPGRVETDRPWRIDPGYLIPDVFGGDRAMEDELDALITGGYLLDSLIWQANWLRLRHSFMSTVVRYEDLVAAGGSVFHELHRFLFDKDMPRELSESVGRYLAEYRQSYQPESVDPRRYPRGYSGKVGVRMDYFSPRNVESYDSVVDGFMRTHPHAALVADLYPDLRIGSS
jgi:hypothetical protein